MKQGMLILMLLVTGSGLAGHALAQDQDPSSGMPAFKFQKNDNFLNPNLSSTLKSDSSGSARNGTGTDSNLRSYDAIFYYPIQHRGVSLDVGLNLRLQEDSSDASLPYAYDRDWLSIDPTDAKPRVHASAIFDLPFSGLKAGVSGSYGAGFDKQDYDYQAKLSYKWRNGFGLEGGWQHQQMSVEQQNLNETLDVQTLFLDLNYRF